jgi:hypothetical protein
MFMLQDMDMDLDNCMGMFIDMDTNKGTDMDMQKDMDMEKDLDMNTDTDSNIIKNVDM